MDMTTTATAPRTRIVQQHWCPAATGKNRRQDAPDASCRTGHQAITCATLVVTARSERRFKDGRIRVTWDNGSASWITPETTR